MIVRFLFHPVIRSYLSLALAGGLVLSTLIIAFEIYVATTGSPDLDFCRIAKGTGGAIPLDEGYSCYIILKYVFFILAYGTVLFLGWSIVFGVSVALVFLVLQKLGLVPKPISGDAAFRGMGRGQAQFYAAALYVTVFVGLCLVDHAWLAPPSHLMFWVPYYPAVFGAVPLLGAVWYLRSRLSSTRMGSLP